MADTRQLVGWSLERKCAFRTGDQWFLPHQTRKQLGDLRTVAAADKDGRNVEGICVTSHTTDRDLAGVTHRIPHSGFRIQERLASLAGLSEAVSMCCACEANAKADLHINVAGCFGHLGVTPDSNELDKQLWSIIKQRNLEQRLRSAFPVTTPLWYGFWINSPIRRAQAEFLHELLNAACDHDDPKDKDIRHFLNALMIAIQRDLPVHVALTPLGHTDFGWYTVFPHCPRCKANAPVGRWKAAYPTTPIACRACGHMFSPNEHQSSERDDFDWDATSLLKQLGKTGHEQFIKALLLHEGCSPQQADQVIDNTNNGSLLRRIRDVRKLRGRTVRLLRQNTLPVADLNDAGVMTIALADKIEMALVLIPGGEFRMGSPDANAHPSQVPQHSVRIPRPIYIGCFSVTQAQWTAVMGNNSSRFRGDPQLPVDQVSWFDCQDFCERLCELSGRVFRLPSEAEWEYACRAGTTTNYAFGETLSPQQANFTPYARRFGSPSSDETAFVRTMELAAESAKTTNLRTAKPKPVGSYAPNAWGIYEMHGNVDEWCEDVWHSNYENAPADGTAWLDGEDGQPFRVIRGGWCSGTEAVCTSTSRRQLRADAGLRSDKKLRDEKKEQGFDSAIIEMFYTPYGFRVVCETL